MGGSLFAVLITRTIINPVINTRYLRRWRSRGDNFKFEGSISFGI